MEPITLFARIADPSGVARLVREIVPKVAIEGPDDNWRSLVITFRDGEGARTLTLNHDPADYSGPDWPTQVAGMRNYFSRFPGTDRKERALLLPTTFRFALGTIFEPDFDPEGDPRLDALFQVAGLLDGVLFTPSSLRDASGRILFGAGGEDEEDPEAVWPKVIGEFPVSNPTSAVNEDEEGLEPPAAGRVAKRALALTAVTARAILEQNALGWGTASAHRKILTWVESIGIGDELEPEEWEVLQRPPGRLESRQQINATWRLESLVVLAWALGRSAIPPHDRLVKFKRVWRSLGLYDVDASRRLLEGATLQPREEIGALRRRLFAIHWRLLNFHLRPEVMDFAEYARTCWFGPLDLTGLKLVKGDLALRGRRLDRAKPDDFSAAHSTSLERHKAANWLWEGPYLYSKASADT